MSSQLLPPSAYEDADADEAIAARHPSKQSMIDSWVRSERDLNAVERFAASHGRLATPITVDRYRDLIPLTNPSPGEQYAFEVDLDQCTGCKACVSGCHHLNGLDAIETWRTVGELSGVRDNLPLLQHITTACHHCIDPACLVGCPTNAYVKDSDTGIVRHLDDQCFGCQYCTMTCPYNVPQYNTQLGIVRKCDMCHDRLAAGEAPACVQACPTQAIRITVVRKDTVADRLSVDEFLPSTPPTSLTTPTTIYRSTSPLPAHLTSPTHENAIPQHAHWALVAMLVLTQWSVGAATASGLSVLLSAQLSLTALWIAFAAGALGLIAATAHLGRPHLAFRGVLGWRHSWLSREAIAFGVFMGSLSAWIIRVYAAPAPIVSTKLPSPDWLAVFTLIAGWIGVFCSARIYQFTRRVFWLGLRTSAKFLLTTLLFTELFTLLCHSQFYLRGTTRHVLIPVFVVTLCAKLLYEAVCCHSTGPHRSMLATSHFLMWHILRKVSVTRWALAGATIVGSLLMLVTDAGPTGHSWTGLLAWGTLASLLAGELLERWLFFAAVVPWRMPGGRSA